ncbi:MAG: hypothetical protein PHZ07_00985 [Patescibacteria group bacterium]|nr:hypothetical protein [Patescibacteria group bacterium]MDD4304644.1 hypothetical protein [Patescibacteria group bacterium]MDD4695571.1 hypothetical protein [Patescibacteria group bacterium]
MKRFKLTPLEKACLLKKAGIIESLAEYDNSFSVREFDTPYDPKKSPAMEFSWDEAMEFRSYRKVFKILFSGKLFVVVENYWEGHTPDNDGICQYFYVFQSEGEEIDNARIICAKLEELFRSSKTHLPEALEMLRVEYPNVLSIPST